MYYLQLQHELLSPTECVKNSEELTSWLVFSSIFTEQGRHTSAKVWTFSPAYPLPSSLCVDPLLVYRLKNVSLVSEKEKWMKCMTLIPEIKTNIWLSGMCSPWGELWQGETAGNHSWWCRAMGEEEEEEEPRHRICRLAAALETDSDCLQCTLWLHMPHRKLDRSHIGNKGRVVLTECPEQPWFNSSSTSG